VAAAAVLVTEPRGRDRRADVEQRGTAGLVELQPGLDLEPAGRLAERRERVRQGAPVGAGRAAAVTDDGHCPEQIRREHCKHASSHWPPAQPGTIEPAPWNGGPGNRRDRGRFLVLSADRRKAASDLAASKSGGTLTAARCWAEALDETAGTG